MNLATTFRLIGLSCLLSSAWLDAAPAPSPTPTAPSVAAPSPVVVEIKPVRDLSLYSTSIALSAQTEAARQAAYGRALVQVLNQLSGQTNAGSNPVVRGALGHARDWSISTAEEASDVEGNTLIAGTPVFKSTVKIAFDANAIDSLLAAANLKYWTGARPKPILWLSIDDGRGPRLVSAQQLNVIRSLAERGTQRGLRFLVPQGTAQELAALPLVLNLDGAGLQALNARYQNDSLLVGKVYRSVSGWSAWWSLWQDGKELSRWPFTAADARAVIASGADNSADFFAQRDSVYLNAGRSGLVTVRINSVQTLSDYVRVMGYLQRQAVASAVNVTRVDSEQLSLQVNLRSGVHAFRGLMRSGSVLQPVAVSGDDSAASDSAAEYFILNH